MPWRLVIELGDQLLKAQVFVWNVTHGGTPRSQAEYRIQISSSLGAKPRGYMRFLLGWYGPLGVFAACDPRFHRHPGASPSIQMPLMLLENAASTHSFVAYQRGNHEWLVAFPPELLVSYTVAASQIHQIASQPTELQLLTRAASPRRSPSSRIRVPRGLGEERKHVLKTTVENVRDASFHARVLAAYGDACAVCTVQLRVVEAAHIVPVASPGSTDETSNGLALCALHHRAYDRYLLSVYPDYTVHLSKRRMQLLGEEKMGGGADAFRRGLRKKIAVPSDPLDRPLRKYLKAGKDVRGWKP